ncbi:aminotransferase class I/II-fold pyridoxal phosphate-dependent enzyme [Anaerocolumna sedimenticola]|uniref:Aminotransferase class I/II-fold pyridoxal phosphate-dependent enzyme n=1 Tax=Anaerocolumna sedimenticola TaxID=2696063 RepID=A0A6P1TV53_9FIRM|nr:PLP-dependent aminotransferase family protein [Anaerocolumna sedimenticola]QHQ63368.1 aminotransferase class I/II-fold pyridoxal phosphate-dependent enzyme [Anaerocolumna sedimenticola]
MFIKIDRNSKIPLKKQVYDTIINDIVTGKLKAGEKIPSTRIFSDSLSVARNILVEVYEQLISEGYLEVVKGKGTFISSVEIKPIPNRETIKEIYQPAKISDVISFECGIPDLSNFPRNVWAGFLKESMFDMTSQECGYSHILGYKPLRIEIADYLQNYKGICCSSSQVFITSGTSDAIEFLSLLFRNRCPNFIYEEFTVPFIPDIFRLQGYHMKTISVDEGGISVKELQDEHGSVICVSPSHQFPLGGTLSFERRKIICDWLLRNHSFLIEDDYDSEFRYKGASVNSLYQLAPDHVLHLGTFSKTLIPALRLGYMVIPETMLEEARQLRALLRKSNDLVNQIALYKFIASSKYTKHIFKMKKIYKSRMLYITSRLRELFGDEISINGENSGLHIAVTFLNYRFDEHFAEILLQNGLSIDLLTDYQQNPSQETNTLIFGFGNLNREVIEDGLQRFKEVMNLYRRI